MKRIFREVVVIYAFYADVFWLNSFLLHAAILVFASECQKRQGKRQVLRCIASSAAGSTLELLILLGTGSYRVFLWGSFFAAIPLMVFLAFGKTCWQLFLKSNVLCWGITVMLGGVITALENRTGISQIPFLTGIVGILLGKIGIRCFYMQYKIQQFLLPVTLQDKEKRIACMGLMDTGNLLKEPYRGRAVHIADPKILEQMMIGKEHFLGMVPYQALGTESGLLEIYQVEGMGYLKKGKEFWIRPVIIAKAPGSLLEGKQYGIILNSELSGNSIDT